MRYANITSAMPEKMSAMILLFTSLVSILTMALMKLKKPEAPRKIVALKINSEGGLTIVFSAISFSIQKRKSSNTFVFSVYVIPTASRKNPNETRPR